VREVTGGGLQVKVGEAVFPVEAQSAKQSGRDTIVHGSQVTLTHGFGPTRFYQHGWHSWSPARWVGLDGPPTRILVPERELLADDHGLIGASGHVGSWVGAVEAPGGQVVVLGALGVDAKVHADQTSIVGRADAPIDWFIGHGEAEEVLTRYAEALAAVMGARSVARERPRVWCSWYSFYRDISEDRLLDVLEDVRGWPFDVFLVDDGWETAIGDWRPNPSFPMGMEAFASEVRGAGFVPGLWMAPLIGGKGSELAGRHPDWMVRDDHDQPVVAGHNWGGAYFGLDTTHPEARQFLADTIADAVRWGYGFLKLDFLYGAALPGRRTAPVSREAAYRSGVELIRKVTGPRIYLLACGAPIVPSIGPFDALRIGPDVGPVWEEELNARFIQDYSAPTARYAVSTSHSRLWLAPAIHIDPDVAYFRTRYNLLTEGQKRLLQDLGRITGYRATSDPPAWLDPDESAAAINYLSSEPRVSRIDRYRFRVDGRVVDFADASLDQRP
jgi:alpha-galactosidase